MLEDTLILKYLSGKGRKCYGRYKVVLKALGWGVIHAAFKLDIPHNKRHDIMGFTQHRNVCLSYGKIQKGIIQS